MFNEYFTIIFFIMLAIVVLDVHYIGMILILLDRSKRILEEEETLCDLNVGKITSSCFTKKQEPVVVRNDFTQLDSKVALTNTCIYIGKKLLSSHYKIPIVNVKSIKGDYKNKVIFKITIVALLKDRECFVEIDSFIFTEATEKKFKKFVSIVDSKVK